MEAIFMRVVCSKTSCEAIILYSTYALLFMKREFGKKRKEDLLRRRIRVLVCLYGTTVDFSEHLRYNYRCK